MMEEDADFFPRGDSAFEESGTMLIREGNLLHLEEALEKIEHRAKYYGEYSMTKLDFIQMIEGLKQITDAIRRTAR